MFNGGNAMSESKKFQWDDAVLVPESLEITFPAEVTGSDPVTVIHYELPRVELVNFVSEGIDKKFINEVEKEVDGVKQMVVERTAFKDVVAEQETLLFKYLAKSSRGKQTVKFYAGLQLGAGALIALVDAFLKLNHLEEITASGGNWFLLPTIRAMVLEADANLESQKLTSEA
jgi:hypothetical protein